MRIVAVFLAAAVVQAGAAQAVQVVQTPAGYSRAVMRICAGALLFDGRHQIGTRAGAIAVAKDIRATGGRRLRRVDAVPKPASTAPLASRWIGVERRLVELYASTYLQIWYEIERADSAAERAGLAHALRALLRRPVQLQYRAAILQLRLRVADCTGGRPSPNTTTAAPR
jgi:hypothetical protein